MTAEIISVGTELLLGQIVDTHAPTMARLLAECGISCARRATIGDNMGRLVGALRESLERADLVVCIGGLGPTMDDLTRDAIAEAFGEGLVREPEMEERLRRFFAQRNLPWNESIGRQADRPESARLIDNPNGTAPGLLCEKDGKIVIALPGPKGEFDPMAKGPVKEYLCRRQGGTVIHSRILRVVGMGESTVEAKIRPLMEAENPTVAPYAHTGEVHLRLTARAASVEEAARMIAPIEAQVRETLGSHLYGADDVTLEAATLQALRERGATVAVAESMSGGGLGERLTSVSGSSAVFLGGVIAYSAPVKQALLGVSPEALAAHGPVSEPVAREMAERVRERLGATYGVSVTGNAGPTSDAGGQPVGQTYVACAGPKGTVVDELKFRGTREDVRRRATQAALNLLRNSLLAV